MLSASKAALLMHLRGSCSNTGGCLPLNSHPHKGKLETLPWLHALTTYLFLLLFLELKKKKSLKKKSTAAEMSSESAEAKKFC